MIIFSMLNFEIQSFKSFGSFSKLSRTKPKFTIIKIKFYFQFKFKFSVFNFSHFTVNGGWSNWSRWNVCTTSCGQGRQSRSRACNNPSPRSNGLPCEGNGQEQRTCSNSPCPGTILYLIMPCWILIRIFHGQDVSLCLSQLLVNC